MKRLSFEGNKGPQKLSNVPYPIYVNFVPFTCFMFCFLSLILAVGEFVQRLSSWCFRVQQKRFLTTQHVWDESLKVTKVSLICFRRWKSRSHFCWWGKKENVAFFIAESMVPCMKDTKKRQRNVALPSDCLWREILVLKRQASKKCFIFLTSGVGGIKRTTWWNILNFSFVVGKPQLWKRSESQFDLSGKDETWEYVTYR